MNLHAPQSAHPPGWTDCAIQGTGLGLRGVHIPQILEHLPEVSWFEILADNHQARGGFVHRQLETIRAHYPITFHCVGMSLGSIDPLDRRYLSTLKRMIDEFEPAWVSDHLSFSRLAGRHYHDLLPIPYSEECLDHVSGRVRQIQDMLGQQILVENVSSYLEFTESTLTEAEFLQALCDRTDCALLLDINNVYVNSVNHGFDARACVDAMPLDRVREIHLAGFEQHRDYLLDAHNHPVADAVWALFEHLLERRRDIPVLIEWDNNIPAFEVLKAEADKAAGRIERHARMEAG